MKGSVSNKESKKMTKLTESKDKDKDTQVKFINKKLNELKIDKREISKNEKSKDMNKCGYCYDSKMLLHKSETQHVERPERILTIYENLMNFIKKENLEEKFVELKSQSINLEFIKKYVPNEYLSKLKELENTDGDTYINDHTYEAALLSAGCTIKCLDSIFKDKVCDSAFAIVRPPGHHCAHIQYQGFCFLNNVYLAYLHAKHILGIKKIVIVDWDVHDGDGTYHLIKNKPDVLFFSLHRYDEKRFYPGSGDPNKVGEDEAKFTKANIGWSTLSSKWATSLSRVSDHEYIYAFKNFIIPIIKEYSPELILISSGFDSAENDPLGEIRLTPIGYSYMTRELKAISKVVVVLEGGYNLDSLSRCSESIFKTLVNFSIPYKGILLIKDSILNNTKIDDILKSKYFEPNEHIIEVVNILVSQFKEKWKSLNTVFIKDDFIKKNEKEKMIDSIEYLYKNTEINSLKIKEKLNRALNINVDSLKSDYSDFKDYILISFGSEFINYKNSIKIDVSKYLELLNEFEQTTLKDHYYCIESFSIKNKNSKLVSKFDLNFSDFYHILNDIDEIIKEKLHINLNLILNEIKLIQEDIYKLVILIKIVNEEIIIEFPSILVNESSSFLSQSQDVEKTKHVVSSLEYISNYVFQHLKKNDEYFENNQTVMSAAGGCLIF